MADANTGITRLETSDAVNAILINEDTERTPSEDKVTPKVKSDKTTLTEDELNAATLAEDAVVTEAQADSTNMEDSIDPPEEQPESAEEEVEEEAEVEEVEEPADDQDESEEEPEELENEDVIFTDSEGNEITVEEAKRGYLRQADYTKKTQALAEERTQLQEHYNQVGTERQTLAEHLNLALNVIEPQLAEYARTNWDALAAEDAYEYAEKRALFDQAKARYEQISQAAQQVVHQQKAQQQQRLQQKLAEEAKALQMAIPDMADKTKAQRVRAEIRDYAVNVIGLNEQEASSIYDHRMIVMMDKARKFDQLEASSLSAAKKKVSKTPKKVVSPGKPSSKSEQKQSAQKQRLANLKRTGSEEDAIALMMGL